LSWSFPRPERLPVTRAWPEIGLEPLRSYERVKEISGYKGCNQGASDIFDHHGDASKPFADAQIAEQQREEADADCKDGEIHSHA
jgi:hypothetical protein